MPAKLTTEEFIRKAKKIHGKKYCYSKVKYIIYSHKIIISCQKHGYFLQTPHDHLAGYGCPVCSGRKVTTKEFIKKSRKIHGKKFDYSKTNYKGSFEKVTIICPIHGEFEQIAHKHFDSQYGCPKCGIIRQHKAGNLTAKFIKRARKIHGDKYNYDKVDYKGNQSKVTIICPDHGDFLQSAGNHLSRKSGCPLCASLNLKRRLTFTTKEFVHRAREIHGNKYNYDKVDYEHNRKNVIIICPVHGEFKQTPGKHNGRKQGCPKCNSSHGEERIRQWLNNKKLQCETQKTFSNCINPKTNHRLKYDFYLPERNILIEYNGQQHYQEVRYWKIDKLSLQCLQYRDEIKKDYAISHGYKYLVIKYDDKNIEKTLIDTLFS